VKPPFDTRGSQHRAICSFSPSKMTLRWCLFVASDKFLGRRSSRFELLQVLATCCNRLPVTGYRRGAGRWRAGRVPAACGGLFAGGAGGRAGDWQGSRRRGARRTCALPKAARFPGVLQLHTSWSDTAGATPAPLCVPPPLVGPGCMLPVAVVRACRMACRSRTYHKRAQGCPGAVGPGPGARGAPRHHTKAGPVCMQLLDSCVLNSSQLPMSR